MIKFITRNFSNGQLNEFYEDTNIEDTFEYNDNLLFHGYDRIQKKNIFFRFDGENRSEIGTNFHVGSNIEFKEKLIVNIYDQFRNY